MMVNRFNIGGNGIRHVRELVPDRKTLRDAFAAAEAFAEANPDMRFVSGVCTPLCYLDTAPYPHIRFTKCSTDLTGRPVTVNYNGDVRFCNHSPRVLGNIHSRTIGDILTDPEMRKMRPAPTMRRRMPGRLRAGPRHFFRPRPHPGLRELARKAFRARIPRTCLCHPSSETFRGMGKRIRIDSFSHLSVSSMPFSIFVH